MTSEQLLARTPGLSYRMLDHWVRKGYLRPATKGGTGNAREWSGDEVRVAQKMARLVAAGLTPAAAHEVARAGGDAELAPGVRVVVEEPAHV